jgi:lactoylglutathione lyase
VLELTHNWDTPATTSATATATSRWPCRMRRPPAPKSRQRGGKVVREAGPMKHGKTIIAFVEDPDGYKIELIQRD